MAWKILGQVAPLSQTLSPLYSPGQERQATISSFKICNQSPRETTFRVAIIPSGQTLEAQHYIYYDEPLRRSFSAVEGWTLAEGDSVQVSSASASCSFSLFGVEVEAS